LKFFILSDIRCYYFSIEKATDSFQVLYFHTRNIDKWLTSSIFATNTCSCVLFVLDNVEFGCFVKAMMKEKRFTNYCPYTINSPDNPWHEPWVHKETRLFEHTILEILYTFWYRST
jgi:hypothetical protein